MLKFRYDFCSDKEINDSIKRHICKRILAIMEEDMIAFRHAGALNPANHMLIEAVSGYFPMKYPRKKVGKAYLELYDMLTESKERVPKPLLEYALKTILRAEVDRMRLCRRPTVAPIEDRERVKEAIIQDCIAMGEKGKEVERRADTLLNRVEDLSRYPDEICTWSDGGYGLLDYFIGTSTSETLDDMEREIEEFVLTDG